MAPRSTSSASARLMTTSCAANALSSCRAMATLDFVKMHGCGNDYIYVVADRVRPADPAALARRLSDRHFGIGADGLIMLAPSDRAAVRMEMYNADGSRGDMCGNGIRCVARLAYEKNPSVGNPIAIETDVGVMRVALNFEDGNDGRDGKDGR